MAQCEYPQKYFCEMTRPCGCYHWAHSTPHKVCLVHAAFMKETIHAERETHCQQCGEYNKIKLLSLKTILWPKFEEDLAA